MSSSTNNGKPESALCQFAASLPEAKAVRVLDALGSDDPDAAMEDILTIKELERYLTAKFKDQVLVDNQRLTNHASPSPPVLAVPAPIPEVQAVMFVPHSVETYVVANHEDLQKKHNATIHFKKYGQEITITCPSEDELVRCQLDIWGIIGKEQKECKCIYSPEIIEHFRKMTGKEQAEFHNTTKVTFKIIDQDHQDIILFCSFSNFSLSEVVANLDSTICYSVDSNGGGPKIPQISQPTTAADNSYFDSIFGTKDDVREVPTRLGETTLLSQLPSVPTTSISNRTESNNVQRRLGEISISSRVPRESTTPTPIHVSTGRERSSRVPESTTPIVRNIPITHISATPIKKVDFAKEVNIKTFERENSVPEVERSVQHGTFSDCISFNASQRIIEQLTRDQGAFENALTRQLGMVVTVTNSFGGVAIRFSAATEANLFLTKEYIWEKLSEKQQIHKSLYKKKYLHWYLHNLSKKERIIFFTKTEVTLEIKDLETIPKLVLRAFNELALERAFHSLEDLVKYNMQPSHLP